MARVKRGTTVRKRHKKIINLAKGYRGRNNNVYKVALGKVEKALQYAYRDRRNKKRDFRALWIQRINAAVRMHGISYSRFINALNLSGIELNRKMLSELAVRDELAFGELVNRVKQHLPSSLVAN